MIKTIKTAEQKKKDLRERVLGATEEGIKSIPGALADLPGGDNNLQELQTKTTVQILHAALDQVMNEYPRELPHVTSEDLEHFLEMMDEEDKEKWVSLVHVLADEERAEETIEFILHITEMSFFALLRLADSVRDVDGDEVSADYVLQNKIPPDELQVVVDGHAIYSTITRSMVMMREAMKEKLKEEER